MSAATAYLLDTNVVLHATRANSPFAAAVEAQFQLRQSPFRPAISEVTVAELWAFAQSWGQARRALLSKVIAEFLVLPTRSRARRRGRSVTEIHFGISRSTTCLDRSLRHAALTLRGAPIAYLFTTPQAYCLPARGTGFSTTSVNLRYLIFPF